jgi:hypothetical protein
MKDRTSERAYQREWKRKRRTRESEEEKIVRRAKQRAYSSKWNAQNKERRKEIARNWAVRFYEQETTEARGMRYAKKNAARNAKRWAANPESRKRDRPLGQCTACKEILPNTAEFFIPLRVKGRDYLSAECRECRNKRFRIWYDKDPASQVAKAAGYVKNNPQARAAKNNRDMIRYMRRKKRGCPPWANYGLMQSLYVISDALTDIGHPHQVDHIYPLIHPRLCGLHVPWNLRVVPTALNQAKGNRLPFDTGKVIDCTSLL